MADTYTNIMLSRRTHQQIDRLATMLDAEAVDGVRVSKHRAVAIAVAEAIRRRSRPRRKRAASRG